MSEPQKWLRWLLALFCLLLLSPIQPSALASPELVNAQVPYPPVLDEIDNTDLNSDYTVRWAYNGPYDVPVPTSYTLQESTNADFSANLQQYPTAASVYSINVNGRPPGTYYYRVRGNNSEGEGEWSNVVSTVVAATVVDNFSDVNSGWARATYKRSDGGDLMNVDYVGGTYRMKIFLAAADQNDYKMGLAKAPDRFIPDGINYYLTVTHYFTQAEMPFPTYEPLTGKAGLVFAANTDYTSLYVFEWNWEGLCAINRYTNFSWPISGYQGFGGSMVTTPIRNWAPCTNLAGNNYNQSNRLLVEVLDNIVRVFVYNNNTKTQIHTFTDDALRSHRRVGLITGSWERTPVESRFDDFLISPTEPNFTLPNTVYLPLTAREWPLLDDLIINGGFESGPPAAPWIQISNAGEMIDPLGKRSGNWGVYMGGAELAIDQITQLVEIPVSVPQAQLTYWYLVRTSDSISTIYDEMVCGIWDQNGDLLNLCGRFSNIDQAQEWAAYTFDLSAYRGRPVNIGFRAINDEALPTQFFVDDVSLSTGITVNGAMQTCNSWAGLEDIGPLGDLSALENQGLDRYPAEFRYQK